MIAALFVRSDSIYKLLPDVDAYDLERNALTWRGGCPVVAHPPCRSWGRLRAFAKPLPGERGLALWAIQQVRKWGGVLEHPAESTLWPWAKLPRPNGERDEWGGFAIGVCQFWWGHKAEKATWLYCCGFEPAQLPPVPLRLGRPEFVVSQSRPRGGRTRRPEISKAEREHTPIEFARYLLAAAAKAERKQRAFDRWESA